MGPGLAVAEVNLELRALAQTKNVGQQVNLGVYAVSDSAANQFMGSGNVVLGWNPTYLTLLGLSQAGASPQVLSAAFPPLDPYGINEASPPADGSGIIQVIGQLSGPEISATPSGTLLTTIRFNAVAQTPLTLVSILNFAGSPPAPTQVFDGPNDVTGTLGSAAVTIVPEPASILLLLALAAIARRQRKPW